MGSEIQYVGIVGISIVLVVKEFVQAFLKSKLTDEIRRNTIATMQMASQVKLLVLELQHQNKKE